MTGQTALFQIFGQHSQARERKKDGLVFIPNRNLAIHESEQGKSYPVFIRETAQFFIYNKENSDFNRYMRGRELIRQLTHDSKHIPKRRRPTIVSLKEKIAELNLLIELDFNNQSYQEVKDEYSETSLNWI